jgi:ribulose kinase
MLPIAHGTYVLHSAAAEQFRSFVSTTREMLKDREKCIAELQSSIDILRADIERYKRLEELMGRQIDALKQEVTEREALSCS